MRLTLRDVAVSKALSELDVLAAQRTSQLLRVAGFTLVALGLGYGGLRFLTTHRDYLEAYIHKKPDLRGALEVTLAMLPAAVCGLIALISWFRVLPSTLAGTWSGVVKLLAGQLEAETLAELEVFWGSPEVTAHSTVNLQLKSVDFRLVAKCRGQKLELTIADHDRFTRSRGRSSHRTRWQLTLMLGETKHEHSIPGEALPLGDVGAFFARALG